MQWFGYVLFVFLQICMTAFAHNVVNKEKSMGVRLVSLTLALISVIGAWWALMQT